MAKVVLIYTAAHTMEMHCMITQEGPKGGLETSIEGEQNRANWVAKMLEPLGQCDMVCGMEDSNVGLFSCVNNTAGELATVAVSKVKDDHGIAGEDVWIKLSSVKMPMENLADSHKDKTEKPKSDGNPFHIVN